MSSGISSVFPEFHSDEGNICTRKLFVILDIPATESLPLAIGSSPPRPHLLNPPNQERNTRSTQSQIWNGGV
ncbi:hypothetical protein TNCV_124481 [Trichonephila clavipes]|nr:hypothetical protein TNCV_124481 [Trichonephila clavipes]